MCDCQRQYRSPQATLMGIIDPMQSEQMTPQIQTAIPQPEKSGLDALLSVITFFQVVKLLDGFEL